MEISLSEQDLKCFLSAIKRARRDHALGTHATVTLRLACSQEGQVQQAALVTSSPFTAFPDTPIPLAASLEEAQSA